MLDRDVWYALENPDLLSITKGYEGVYLIFIPGGPVVRVGQGQIHNRLRDHLNDWNIMRYNVNSVLAVTWAHLEPRYWDGVETFLGRSLGPLEGNRFPIVPPIEVNLPQNFP